ncbi:kinase suppressor of Ras 2-like [Brevipalpus obovatus]|uniref:kinase suppressor of Ras 2-like n=1 Tax=Brevipalpus obovatus TaxID=246614 RepID=UPI003D9F991D
MFHAIDHRFGPTLKVTLNNCQLCEKPMFLGLKCRECKYRCHRDCVDKVPPSCGLPDELINFFRTFSANCGTEDGDIGHPTTHHTENHHPSFLPHSSNEYHDYDDDDDDDDDEPHKNCELTTSYSKIDSERTLDQASDVDTSDCKSWPRQNSLTLKEWDIPYDELTIEEEIGKGRFGSVFRGNWHGDVTIKFFNLNVDDQKALEAFQQEVATFRKTRHENLVLFMGACMKPPHLAIVTSLCKGSTLYTLVHYRKEKFNLSRLIVITQQIAQGMGYLHARGILHKDLKTKNIFYDNGKVIITDFGLCSVIKLCHSNRDGDCITIPKGWLYYLAPELIRSLKVSGKSQDREDLPFSKATDVYAFGTVWYELLNGDWPFKSQPPEVIIWQVGKGAKQTLVNLQSSKEIKDLLIMCWAFRPHERPDFTRLLDILSRLPKKRLQRSPSHPIYLRSAESTF